MPKKDITGERYGKLVAIRPTEKRSKKRSVIWEFQCDCGNTCEIAIGDLKGRKSCGCLKIEQLIENNHKRAKDIANQKFGLLTALYPNGTTNNRDIIWHCKCECGNECDVSGHDLRTGHTKSCGCQRSKSYGEKKVKEILEENNIFFIREYTPPEWDQKIFKPRFDFFIPNLNTLIEYDGIQHFKYQGSGWNTQDNFEEVQKHDQIKNQWCKDNNIPLIRIPYTHLDELCLEDLIPETSKFLIKGDS